MSATTQVTTANHVFTNNPYHVLDFDNQCIAVDSGASDGFGDEDTNGTNRQPTEQGIIMASATGDCKTSIATDEFDLPLPKKCLEYHVFKRGDVQRPLLSVGKVCDAGCNVHFHGSHVNFNDNDNGNLLLRGYRDPRTGLYLLPRNPTLPRTSTNAPHDTPAIACNAYEKQTIPQLMRYLHACAGFPTTDTWIHAINRGYFITWPGLTAARVRLYLPKSEETALGHQKLVRQGIRSTSKGGHTSKGATNEQITSKDVGRKRHVEACSVPVTELKGIIGTDQTGRFPITSARGHKYVFLLCDVDTGHIQAIPIRSRKKGELTRAFKEAYEELVACGFEPVLHRIDHETSDELLKAIKEKGLTYEIMPPKNHRRNPAERAIQTFKGHFISVLNGLDRDFPKEQWDLIMPQVNMTLNMLRECDINPAHSAYSYVNGAFDFSAHPLVPLGCRTVVHERSIANGGCRTTYGNRGKIGYYVGPAMNSYRVWRFYIPETNGVQETDTATFFPAVPLPTVSVASQIAESLETIKQALTERPTPTHSDISEDEKLSKVIVRLRSMYERADKQEDANNQNARGGTPKVKRPTGLTMQYEDEQQNKHIETVAVTSHTDDVGPPRVAYNESINRHKVPTKQRYPIGTRVQVKEKRQTFTGEVTEYDPHTGLYYVEFTDGECDEFDEEEIAYFRINKPYKGQAPSTYANQVIVNGFFPKANPTPHRVLHYGLNAGSIWDEELNKWMAYRDLIKHPNPKIRRRWEQAGNNEFARLAQGYSDVEGMNVITFIARWEMPKDKKATYARYVVDYRPEKDEPWRLRITCGGDKLEYFGDTTTHGASMETIKCQLNSIISTQTAKCATGDISNMYLGSNLPDAEYVRFRLSLIPEGIVAAYNLRDIATPDGYVYARVNKAWYGLKQAGRIAHDDLVERLAEAGYRKVGMVEGYFRHESRPIDFTLVVDDFLIKYVNNEDLKHLQDAIEKYYKFKVDLEAKQYVGINLKWDYNNRTVRLSMDGYVEQALLELEHSGPRRPHYAPSRYDMPRYGEKVQYAKIDQTSPLALKQVRFIQRAVGKLLYYARAVDPTMLHAINDISLSAAKGTDATLDATMYLLNYAHTNPNTEIIYRQSDMILRVDSDAAYLVAPEARSRAGGYHYLSDNKGITFNGPVLVLAKVIKNVMASAAEAELGALFMNGQEAIGLRNCLEAMGYPQPATPMKTDNNTANGILNNTMKQKRSKAIDVRFYWLRDRAQQGQFYIFWDAGKNNLADYFTKHHPAAMHKLMRPIHTYIEALSPKSLQGCIEMMNDRQARKRLGMNPNPKKEKDSTTAPDVSVTNKK